MIVGAAGVPRRLAETRDYDQIFGELEAAGIQIYFPAMQYVEFPAPQTLGFESDFLPPPWGTATPAVYEAMRAHGIKLMIPAEFLYALGEPYPSPQLDPLLALITAAGRDLIYGVYSYDEPAHRGIAQAESQRLYAHVKAIDPSLPIVQVHRSIDEDNASFMTAEGRAAHLSEILGHAQWADIVGFDVYPVGPTMGSVTPYGNGQRAAPAQAVREYMDWLKVNLPDKQHVMVLQGFGVADLFSPEVLAEMDPALVALARAPTAQEMADMLAATEGAAAVWWWGQSHLEGASSQTWQNLLARTEAWVTLNESSPAMPTQGNDTILGGASSENLQGLGGRDWLFGRGGDDTLGGGAGADTLDGGLGDDTYNVDALDLVYEAAASGFDRVYANASYMLRPYADVEVLATNNAGLTAAIALSGNGFGQTIAGNAGSNAMDGGANTSGQRDLLYGYAGDDAYFVDGTDLVYETVGNGFDLVFAATSYALRAPAAVEALGTTNAASTTAINLAGNGFDQSIQGNAGANVLNGGAGNDTLYGLRGADSFLFSTALNAATNVDYIADFNVAADTIRLENAIFTALATPGTLAAGAFRIGAAAVDADDRIIYNSATGALSYDGNGSAAGGATQFAVLATGLALTNADFLVV